MRTSCDTLYILQKAHVVRFTRVELDDTCINYGSGMVLTLICELNLRKTRYAF